MQKIKILKLNQQHFSQAANCLASGFLREPMSQIQQISLKEMLEFCESVIGFAINNALSFVALDQEMNVIGVIINKDFVESPIAENIEINDKFIPIFDLLEKLDAQFQKNLSVEKGIYFHSLMIAVDENTTIKNISTLLQNASFEEAIQLGFKFAVLEATGPISQHIAKNKFGYKIAIELKYKDYKFNNKAIFKDIETNESCQLLLKEF